MRSAIAVVAVVAVVAAACGGEEAPEPEAEPVVGYCASHCHICGQAPGDDPTPTMQACFQECVRDSDLLDPCTECVIETTDGVANTCTLCPSACRRYLP